MNNSPRIRGFGCSVPDRIVANDELARRINTSDEWIVSRTGIRERRIVAPGQTGTDLALAAAQSALARADCRAADITHIFYATCTPDACCPTAACILADKLGIKGSMAFDLNAACCGFVYGMELARNACIANPAARVLLVASETLSHRCNWEDRSTCVLFGDGAGAVVIDTETEREATAGAPLRGAAIQDVLLSSDGSLGDLLRFGDAFYSLGQPVGEEYFVHMQGREVFKHAVRSMSAICDDLLLRNGLAPEDIDVLVPHQANMRIIEAVRARLDAPLEKVFINVDKYGNTSAASIPLALADAVDNNFIRPGMNVLLATFGGGFTWGAALLRF
jgi:3-oxoacyl-[acyl-carrier-protein] synthase-3